MEGEFKRVENNLEWLYYSLLAAFSFGIINFMLGDISGRYGMAAGWPIFFGMIPMWLIYQYYNCTYQFYVNNPKAILGIVIRGTNHLFIIIFTTVCFQYADIARVNKGVIASLFTSGIIFTSINFSYIYQEHISLKSGCSMLVIISGIVCVGLGKNDGNQSSIDMNLVLAIVFALLCGFCFSINAILMRHYV